MLLSLFLHPFIHHSTFGLDVIQWPHRLAYPYVLVTVCVLSGGVEAFPCHKTETLTMANKLLDVFPIGVCHIAEVAKKGPGARKVQLRAFIGGGTL